MCMHAHENERIESNKERQRGESSTPTIHIICSPAGLVSQWFLKVFHTISGSQRTIWSNHSTDRFSFKNYHTHVHGLVHGFSSPDLEV